MEWKQLSVRQFSLQRTIESGQFFRYRKEGEHHIIMTEEKYIRIAQAGSTLLYTGASEQFIERFLGLDAKNERWIARLRQDPVLRQFLDRYSGLRIMSIDLHETILGFICSTNSNIPKIRRNMSLLTQAGMPEPGARLDETAVRRASTGYRAKYIVRANEMLTREYMERLRSAPYEEARDLLQELPGIGPKVADCICLFSLGHGHSFPIDVHVGRAMQALFPEASDPAAFARRRWGDAAGMAQQYIFLHGREVIACR